MKKKRLHQNRLGHLPSREKIGGEKRRSHWLHALLLELGRRSPPPYYRCPWAFVCQCQEAVSVCVVQPEADIRRICVVCPKACVGHPKVCVGCPKVCVGCPKVCVGRPKICVGRPKVCVGRPKACVGVMIIWWGSCPEGVPGGKTPWGFLSLERGSAGGIFSPSTSLLQSRALWEDVG